MMPESQEEKTKEPALTINDKPIYLVEDWEHGIGGGLWSTGLAMAKYFASDHAKEQLSKNAITNVLELGSGNGFLGVCLLAACPTLNKVVITDTKEHLPLMETTVKANPQVVQNENQVLVKEYLWGTTPSWNSHQGDEISFDLIIGSDVAYRDELHDPLIAGLLQFSPPTSKKQPIIMLGVTLLDTKPIFFRKLSDAGFVYERLADHLLDPSFRGTNFGIFVIQKKMQ